MFLGFGKTKMSLCERNTEHSYHVNIIHAMKHGGGSRIWSCIAASEAG